MKKIILTLAVVLCAASVSAQSWVNDATTASKWSLGVRVLSGFQADAQFALTSGTYLEGRFGAGWHSFNGVSAHFELLHNWNCGTWDWTPNAGEWFFDAGCGVAAGGREHWAYVGVAGQAKFGIAFSGAPVKLAIDWTPCIGPSIGYGKDALGKHWSNADFYDYGFCNFGISCVYCF